MLSLLPPGTYRVEYALTGLKNVVHQGVVVNATLNTAVNAQMSLGVAETMTITASPVVVDPTQTQLQLQLQQTFNEDHLKYAAIGQNGRSYQTSSRRRRRRARFINRQDTCASVLS